MQQQRGPVPKGNADWRVEPLESDAYDEVLTVPFADRVSITMVADVRMLPGRG